jgi:hypothetical protein
MKLDLPKLLKKSVAFVMLLVGGDLLTTETHAQCCAPPIVYSQVVPSAASSLPANFARVPAQVIHSSIAVYGEYYGNPVAMNDQQLSSEISRVRRILSNQQQQLAYQALDSEIRMTQSELQAAEQMAREYQSFNRFIVGNPLPLSAHWQNQAALMARERYQALQLERGNLQRFGQLEQYLNELEFQWQARQAK